MEGCPRQSRGLGRAGCRLNLACGPGRLPRVHSPPQLPLGPCCQGAGIGRLRLKLGPYQPALLPGVQRGLHSGRQRWPWNRRHEVRASCLGSGFFCPRVLPDPQRGVGAWGWAGYIGPIALCRACGDGPRGLSQLPSHSLHQSGASGRGRLGHPAPGAAPRAAPGWCVFGERAGQQPRAAEVSQGPCEGPELPSTPLSQHPNSETPALQH